MSAASIVLAVLAFLCAGLGFLATPIPRLGLVLSFAAPALAVAGMVVGGIAMSRRKQENASTEAANTGVILNAIAFVPGLLVALTCGVCNALCSVGEVQFQRDLHFRVGPVSGPDAGPLPSPPAPAGRAPETPEGAPASRDAQGKTEGPRAEPPVLMPPPPLPAGPRPAAER